jgi:DNA-binding NtrC family response regulator
MLKLKEMIVQVAPTENTILIQGETGTGKELVARAIHHHLNVLTLNVPPLRDRLEDIAQIVRHFLDHLASTASLIRGIARETVDVLERYRWPGNVRELENTIQRAVALGRQDAIYPEDLPDSIYPRQTNPDRTGIDPAGDSLAAYEMAAIRNALSKCGNNRARAARILGIGEATLYRKIKKI